MSTHYQEYRRQRRKPKKTNTFLKKLIFQTLVSAILLATTIYPNVFKGKLSEKVGSTAKYAFTHKLDMYEIKSFFLNISETLKANISQDNGVDSIEETASDKNKL